MKKVKKEWLTQSQHRMNNILKKLQTRFVIRPHLILGGIEATFLSKIDFIDTLIQLSAFEKSVLHLHLTTHKNTNEIATELNVKIEKIYCTFYQIKKKLRNKFVD